MTNKDKSKKIYIPDHDPDLNKVKKWLTEPGLYAPFNPNLPLSNEEIQLDKVLFYLKSIEEKVEKIECYLNLIYGNPPDSILIKGKWISFKDLIKK